MVAQAAKAAAMAAAAAGMQALHPAVVVTLRKALQPSLLVAPNCRADTMQHCQTEIAFLLEINRLHRTAAGLREKDRCYRKNADGRK